MLAADRNQEKSDVCPSRPHSLLLAYKDAPAAIDFLCKAFGFDRHAVYADDKDPSFIHHAQLVRDGQDGDAEQPMRATAII